VPLNYPAPSEALWVEHLRTHEREILGLAAVGASEARDEDYVVSGLVDFDDVAYDDQADLLYELACQTVAHFRSYLPEDAARRVLQVHRREIARFIHAQMQEHYWEEAVEYEATVTKGWDTLRESAFSAAAAEAPLDFRQSPADKSNMARYLFVGFKRCLFSRVRFQSEPERRLAVILDREAEKWFRPARGQFRIFYRLGSEHAEYQPDFVAQTASTIHMLECKSRAELDSPEVLAKRQAAIDWCRHATNYSATCSGKPWKYSLLPHDVIAENMTLEFLAKTYG
jgi:type III restriction enzyme